MILAAGLGTRLAPFTDRLPKPLLPFFDVPLIEYGVRRLVAAGITEVVVNTYHRSAPLERFLQELAGRLADEGVSVRIHISAEATLQGTGGGIAQARHFFAGRTLLLVNSDIHFEFDLTTLLEEHRRRGALATVLLHCGQGREHLRSTLCDTDGRLAHIGPAGPDDPRRGVFTGIYALEPAFYEALPQRPCSVITEGFRPAMEAGQPVFGVRRTFPWTDLGTWADYHAACMAVLATVDDSGAQKSPRRVNDGRPTFADVLALAPGRFILSPESALQPPLYLGPGARLEPGALAGPGAVLGAGAVLGPDARVSRAVVFPGSHVAGAVRDSVALGEGRHLGI